MPEAPAAAPPAAAPTGAASIDSAARSAGAMTGGNRGSGALESGKTTADAFAALEKKGAPGPGQEAPKQPPKQPQRPPPPKQETKPPEQKQEEPPPPEKTEETTTEPEKPVPGKARRPADFLREEKDKWKSEAEKYKTELEQLRSGQNGDNPEVKTWREKHEAETKRRQELEDQMRFVAYERSEEYKGKYEQPFIDAYNTGRSRVAALKVVEKTNDLGEVVRAGRTATPADFDAIMTVGDDEAAAALIEDLFGTGYRAGIVAHAREKVLELNNARTKALEEFKKTGAEREKVFREKSEALHNEVKTSWQDSIKPDHIPDQWRPYVLPKGKDKDGKDIDQEGDSLLERGYAEFDRSVTEDARDPNLTTEQRKEVLRRAAAMRHRAAACGRAFRWLKQRDDRIAALEKELAQYRETEPGTGEGGTKAGEEGDKPADTMGGALAALEKRGQAGKPVFF